jgi:glutamine synthetase
MADTLIMNNGINMPNIVKTETKLVVAEYVFIDGFGSTRSKTRIIQGKLVPGQESRGLMFSVDIWNVDGSSTGQSETGKSDIILMPRVLFNDPFNNSNNGIQYCLVMCDILNADGTPHATNTRAELFRVLLLLGEQKINDEDPWFGIEQEYAILQNNGDKDPYGWTTDAINMHLRGGIKKPEEGIFYCGVGANCAFGRAIAMEHMNKCIEAGVVICGINSEVAPSQWEFQIGICNPVAIGDHLWIARYILARVAELHGVCISYDPKPFGPKWNGSGAHTNFSTASMRNEGGLTNIKIAIDKLSRRHKEHMAVYGAGNERRLNGIHETSNLENFTYGECDRGSSVRIPINVLTDGCGYFEDRRPAANADPYLVAAKMLETLLV